MKSVIVLTHRRSGTHLTIDTILNNFPEYFQNEYINLDRINPKRKDYIPFSNIIDSIASKPAVIKTHAYASFSSFKDEDKEQLEKLFSENIVLYIIRHPGDVIVSLFHYQKYFKIIDETTDFNNFIENTKNINHVEKWINHVNEWLFSSKSLYEIESFKFEDIKANPELLISFISQKLAITSSSIKDVDLSKKSKWYFLTQRFLLKLGLIKKLNHSAVFFRKGSTGDWKKYFNSEDLKNKLKEHNELLKKFNYEV